jgi:hypothetical protein
MRVFKTVPVQHMSFTNTCVLTADWSRQFLRALSKAKLNVISILINVVNIDT